MQEIKEIVVEHPLLKIGCTLGEGPVWDAETSTLHFVDIDECKILHYNTVSGEVQVEQLEEKIGCIALRRDGPGLAGATARGFALFEKGDSTLQYLSRPLPEDIQAYTRFNDGGCDSHGRFFAGTMYDQERGIPGQLWMYDPADNSCSIVDPGPFTDSNGLGWSPDEKIFYFTDSIKNVIYAYDYDATTARLTNRRVFVDAIALGFPADSFCDGLCVDMEGGVWSARWGGSEVVRFGPRGDVDLRVKFPSVLNVTSCAFGGPKNDLLYVTTTHCRASKQGIMQERYPDSGHVFVVDLGGRYEGVKRHRFGIDHHQ
ncbi:hypothetical protein FB45DRAFT_917162 [Roridomyces roridus]|uniref:SMP-30/Gluconolactonase/LRE-like region domain-containing protein n=1 Tax=Roridomyces roridus TaxID=1738132 RepID=A0AAD7BVR1_9AGAR|nr:hypothetical protein FB45DRAFT_917162 [Roridomyces roridus]